MSATMLSSKPKSAASDTSNNKTTQASTRVGKLGRAASTKSDPHSSSPLQNSRTPIDRSPKLVESKASLERRSPKLNTPEKQPRGLKGSELQAQIGVAQEDLKKAREQLTLVEQEKARALEELKDAKELANEANEKLKEALAAQRRAEENSEIEKFRADELEQSGIEDAQKKEDEWKREIETVRNQHAVDLASLLSATQELQKVQHELSMASDAKNTALSHADDAMKIAEINAEKVVFLSGEITRMKILLDSKMENSSKDAAELVKKLDSEIDALRNELERAKSAEGDLAKVEVTVEELRTELTDAKRAEMDAVNVVHEWKIKVELLEAELAEANLSKNKNEELVEKMCSELDSLRHKLERANTAEEKLVKTETLVEGLITDLDYARRAEEDSAELVDELKKKAELLEVEVEQANQSAYRSAELVKQVEFEHEALKHELQIAKAADGKLAEMEALVEELKTELTNAERAKMDADTLVDDWKSKTEILLGHVEEANQSEKSLSSSLTSVAEQLEESQNQLQDAESEIAALREIVESLKDEVSGHKADLEASDMQVDVAKLEASEAAKIIEVLKSELQKMEEEKLDVVNNEKYAVSKMESLLEEKNKLVSELEITRDEGEKSKVAMEGLASALHEISTEARETQESLLIKQTELEKAHTEVEELRLARENMKESYEVMLDEARYEVVCLRNSIERFETEAKSSRDEWDAKELNFVGAIKKAEEDLASFKVEMGSMVESLRGVEHKAQAAKEAEIQMEAKLKQAESAEVLANVAAEEAKGESLHLKERLLDKENELQSITQENEDLRIREAAALEKVRQLSAMLADATAINPEQNGEIANSETEYDLLPKSRELTEERVDEKVEKFENSCREEAKHTEENGNGSLNEEGPVKVESKLWESDKITEKDSGSERDHEEESTDDELDSKVDISSIEQISGLPSVVVENGAVSRTKSQQQKKKKDLLHKFGSLLKKKGSHK